jgi:hypothetical protein
MTLCSFSENNKSCGSKATRLEGTDTPLCSDHYEVFFTELKDRALTFYLEMGELPHLIEIAPEVNWGIRWYANEYALIQIVPARLKKSDL